MTYALIFPGQGSQIVGMGRDFYTQFPVAQQTFDAVDDVLLPLYGHKLSDIIFDGPLDKLTQTRYTQPALMVTSLAIFRVMEQEYPHIVKNTSVMAGHSLGEYSALCAAGVISLNDTATLLYHRGKAMSLCVDQISDDDVGASQAPMAAVMGLNIDVIERIVDESGCFIANDNGGGQIVLSGTGPAIARAMDLAQSTGAKRVVPLNVSAPFHSPLMDHAASVMREKIDHTEFHTSTVPVVCNVDATAYTAPDDFQKNLVTQVCGRVRWRESMVVMAERGVTQFIEIGAGKVLTGLCKRTTPDVAAFSINTVDDLSRLNAAS